MQFCEVCSSIMQDNLCTNRRCASRDEALTSWLIDGVLWRFKAPLKYAEAREAVKSRPDLVVKIKKEKKPDNGFIKVPTW